MRQTSLIKAKQFGSWGSAGVVSEGECMRKRITTDMYEVPMWRLHKNYWFDYIIYE